MKRPRGGILMLKCQLQVRSILEELNKSGMTEGTRISRENFEKVILDYFLD